MKYFQNKLYTVEYFAAVIKDDISVLPKTAKTVIKKAIEARLMVDPVGFGKPLRYSLKSHRRLRVVDYRIIYRIDALHHKVIISAIEHRKEVYKDF